jgi:hypothetical protein
VIYPPCSCPITLLYLIGSSYCYWECVHGYMGNLSLCICNARFEHPTSERAYVYSSFVIEYIATCMHVIVFFSTLTPVCREQSSDESVQQQGCDYDGAGPPAPAAAASSPIQPLSARPRSMSEGVSPSLCTLTCHDWLHKDGNEHSVVRAYAGQCKKFLNQSRASMCALRMTFACVRAM